MEPLRKLIQRVHGGAEGGVEFLESECVDIDPQAKVVHCEDRSGVVGAVSAVNVSEIKCLAPLKKKKRGKLLQNRENCEFLKLCAVGL